MSFDVYFQTIGKAIMNTPERQVRDDEPLMIAWKAHQKTEEFQNTLRWAGQSNLGNLWAIFCAGFKAGGGEYKP